MSDEIYEVSSSTPNLHTELARQLEALVPEVIADGKVDVAKLRELLGDDVQDESERFGLFWPGKKRALRAAQEPTTATLLPDRENSKDWDTTQNVFIEGDNLEVLKILQKHYHGKIKMIYIDPPYNTGKDFVYPDNYKEGLESYLEWTRQVSEEGKKLSTNSETDGRYHSNWLNMMYPRLKLARNLLSEDGLIFISIDDHEIDNLIKICNEVFGEQNHISTLAVEMSKTQGMKVAAAQAGQLVKNHEYVLVYCRNHAFAYERRQPLFDASEVYDSHYDIVWEPGKVPVPLLTVLGSDPKSVSLFQQYGLRIGKQDLKRLMEIDDSYHDYFLANIAPKLFRESPISLDNVQQLDLPVDEIVEWRKYILRKNSRGTVVQLQPFMDGVRMTDDYVSSRTRATIRGALWKGFHSDMMNVGKEGGVEFKNGKKPLRLLKQLIKWVNRPEGIVLDFFAGSGSTAEAVIKSNLDDNGRRTFILVQLPEPIEEGRTVSDITRERLTKITVEEQLGGPGVDVGFKAYKLASTNFDKWQIASDTTLDQLQQTLLDFRENADDDATPEDILTELLLKQGFSLTEEILATRVAGLDCFAVGDGALIAYLNEHAKPTLEQLRQILDLGPVKFIILEDAFQGDDELKTNLKQICTSKDIELWTA